MSIIRIKRKTGILKGSLQLPSSKSISNRLLIIRALSSRDFSIDRLSDADDTLLLQDLLSRIHGHQNPSLMTEINTANAGTVMRFLSAYLSMVPGKWILSGSERMKERPIGILVDGLKSLGAKIDYLSELGFPPVMIHGTSLKGREIIVDAGISSQFVSALLLIGPRIPGGLTLHLSGTAVSFPYVDMTIRLMKYFGVNVMMERSRIIVPEAEYIPRDYTVESDWSAAAFLYEAAALAGEADLFLEGLRKDSLQGDAVIAEIFKLFNVVTEYTETGVRITKTKEPVRKDTLRFNFFDHPDIAPAVMTTCAVLGLHGSFSGLKNLQLKESERITALKTEYEKLGIHVETFNTGKTISSVEIPAAILHIPPGLQINSYGDHRMAMTFAPVAIRAGNISIENPEVVTKSYPGFWNDLRSIGFEIN